ncbi:MAG TPA: hypothetical protein ENG59_06345 [Chloroflexi bacterium]|nr:hypothetical protein [Chloroflexota bacterium]
MTKPQRVDWVTIGLIFLLTIMYAWTLPDVPFHPDESTHIYMSKDISQNPLALAWDGTLPLSAEERIRAIDAPLAKYLIGVVREIFSIPALKDDWNWGLSWEENLTAGALPSDQQLLFARSTMVLLLPFSLWLYYLALKKILPAIPSLAAVLLLGLNPLLLLHARRAMSEGPLFLGTALFLWAATRDKRNPWLIGLALGIAVAAKHSALGLIPAAFLSVVFLPGESPVIKTALIKILKTSLVLFITLLLLNPFYWKHPLDALNAGSRARFDLAREQQEDYLGRIGLKGQPLGTTIPGLVLNIFLTPPQTEEVGNYLPETGESREKYLANPIHYWGRGLISGSILAALSLVGVGLAFGRFPAKKPAERNNLLIFALATLWLGVFTIFLIPWQRYVVVLLPFVFSWVGVALVPIFKAGAKSLPGNTPLN